MPYICMIRTDLPDSLVQVVDLLPNTSQRNLIYDGPGQSKYINRGEFTGTAATTVVAVSSASTRAFYGLAAYLADNIASTGTGNLISAATANSAAGLIRDNILDAGAICNKANVDAELVAATGAAGDEELNAGGSTGSVADLLQLFGGGSYLLPAGSAVGTAAGTGENGAFEAGTYRTTYDSGSLKISFGAGKISEYMDATWSYPVNGTAVAGAAFVVYADNGTIYTG
jgi:hypothetical protein